MKNLHTPLLGLPVITNLNFVAKVCNVKLDRDVVDVVDVVGQGCC